MTNPMRPASRHRGQRGCLQVILESTSMNRYLRNLLEFVAFVAVTAIIWIAVPVEAHSADQLPGAVTTHSVREAVFSDR
jgi:hypothetical protein